MKILILSRNRFLYSTRRLVKAARVRGHDVEVANPLVGNLVVSQRLDLSFEQSVDGVDVVLPRIGQSITDYGLAIVRQFEMLGVPVVNRADAIQRSRDKVQALQALCAAGIPIPPTVLTRTTTNIEQAIEAVGGLPVVVKTFRGTQGVGVMLLNSLASLRSILDMMSSMGQDIMIQRFVHEASGRDLRVIVVGDRVVSAMRRESDKNEEFRSNLHRGGKGEPVTLHEDYERAAIDAARALGLEIAGVDVLETSLGPMILEVNAAPGLEGIERANNVDVADAMVEFVEEVTLSRGDRPSSSSVSSFQAVSD